MSKLDVRALIEDLGRFGDAPDAAGAAARALAAPDTVDRLDDGQKHAAEAALVRFALECAAPLQEEAVLALVAIGSAEGVRVCDRLFRDGGDGLAGRLLAQLNGGAAPTADSLIEDLRTGGVSGFPWIIAAQAVAEHGVEAVPALVAALESFPLPARETDHWMRDESAKYSLMHALKEVGPAAAAAVPVLEAISADEEAYRDSRWKAEQALEAIDPNAGV